MKGRREIRRNMLKEKRSIHEIEAEHDKFCAEFCAHRGKVDDGRRTNFHRSINVVYWSKNKHQRQELMYDDHYDAPKYRVRREMCGIDQQLREFSLVAATECESDYTETCVVVAMPRIQPTPRVVAQKRIRPGGRVERRMLRLKQERMEEDAANAAEFAKAIASLRITRMMLREQKGDAM
ncbi:MAG: hypothetical protein IKK43_04950 [Clostridia bacterium]|nr:hypothetical protein [Clostridia bacterium]